MWFAMFPFMQVHKNVSKINRAVYSLAVEKAIYVEENK
jgi:hypothetical protein